MYIHPHKRNVDALLKVGRCDYQGRSVSNALLCGCKIALATDCCCWSIRSAPRGERGWMLSETSEKRKNLYFERYSPVILRILMYGEVENATWQDVISKLASKFVPKLILFTVKKSPWYCGRDHSSAFIF